MKISSSVTRTLILAVLMASACSTYADPYTSQQDPRMQWYMDAKLGLMIHWGVYAVAEGRWSEDGTFDSWKKGDTKPYKGYAEQIMRLAAIPREEYRKLPEEFDWSKWNAQDIIDLCYATGQRYIVITAKHHDGFAMYHSKVDPFNVVDATPYGRKTGRDPLKELADACHATATNGSPWEIKMCFYYSQCVDWMEDGPHPHGYKYSPAPNAEQFEKYFDRKFYPQIKELMTNYGDVGLIWYDVPRVPFASNPEQAKKVVDMMKSLQPETLINGRFGHMEFMDYLITGDNGVAGVPTDYYWETPVSMNHTYGYGKDDHEWKNWEDLAEWFVKTIAHNGNYLLNIGPKGDGTIPAESLKILHDFGKWVKPHSEAIFGTRASPYRGTSMTSMEWGYATQKDKNLYLFVRHWPDGGVLELPLVKNKIRQVSFLIANNKQQLDFTSSEDSRGNRITKISIPEKAPTRGLTVIKVEVEGEAFELDRIKHFYDPDKKQFILEARDFHAEVAAKPKIFYNRALGAIDKFWVGKGNKPGERAVWQIDVPEAGKYKMKIEYSCHPGLGAGKETKVFIDDAEALTFVGQNTPGDKKDAWQNFGTYDVGTVELKSGLQSLKLAGYRTGGNSSWNIAIKRIVLTKVK